MPDVFRIADILVAHALRVHPDDIAIIAYYGSHSKGLASPTSDLDLFYIPDEGKAGSLCCQFVFDGLPYDFWPVSWTMAEEIANARSDRPWAVSASLVADAVVLHHRAQDDLDRFVALQARIEALTQPESRAFMVGRALDAYKEVCFQLEQLRMALDRGDAAGAYWASSHFVYGALNCLALVNQRYFSKGWGANLAQAALLPQAPENLEVMIQDIMMPQGGTDRLDEARRLAGAVRAILAAAQASVGETVPLPEMFADFYFFVFEYVNKVLSACQRQDVSAAGAAATQLQQEIAWHLNKVERGFFPADFHRLGEYIGLYAEAGFPDLIEPAERGDLSTLAERAREVDEHARAWLTGHSVPLNILADEADLARFLEERDPGG